MPLPEAFVRDYQQFRERWRWARPDPEAEVPVPVARDSVADLDAFLLRWQPHIHLPQMRDALAGLRAEADDLRQRLDNIRHAHLCELVEARADWVIGRKLFDTSITYIAMMKECPAELRPGLEQIYRESMGKEFTPETEYRDSEASADKAEAEFHASWREFQEHWPEDATEALHRRLLKAGTEEIKAWEAELTAKPRPPAAQ